MSLSTLDAINLAASATSLIGAGITVGGYIQKRLRGVASPPPQPHVLPVLPVLPVPSPSPAAPYTSPAAPPFSAPSPASSHDLAPHPPMTSRQRIVNHPLILGGAVLGILTVLVYTLELVFAEALTGSTGLPPGSPLIVLNAVLVTLNLLCTFGVLLGMVIVAARATARTWLIASVVLLVVGVCSVGYAIGIFSAVALVPPFSLGSRRPEVRWSAWQVREDLAQRTTEFGCFSVLFGKLGTLVPFNVSGENRITARQRVSVCGTAA